LDPPQGLHRIYWLMGLLEKSMLEGAHIASGLYVPKAVWFQTGAKLFAQQAKITYCTNITENLRELKKIEVKNAKEVIKGLDVFLAKAEKEREALNKQLPNAAKAESAMVNSSNKLFSGKVFKNIYKSAIGLVSGGKRE